MLACRLHRGTARAGRERGLSRGLGLVVHVRREGLPLVVHAPQAVLLPLHVDLRLKVEPRQRRSIPRRLCHVRVGLAEHRQEPLDRRTVDRDVVGLHREVPRRDPVGPQDAHQLALPRPDLRHPVVAGGHDARGLPVGAEAADAVAVRPPRADLLHHLCIDLDAELWRLQCHCLLGHGTGRVRGVEGGRPLMGVPVGLRLARLDVCLHEQG
mmetsp:Transcript_103239/g.321720  ORF Transcript_103239/g.321720 Transcript_103239/m.321720 type:complete len:211 (-) Transcript_103239:935-1567(-)